MKTAALFVAGVFCAAWGCGKEPDTAVNAAGAKGAKAETAAATRLPREGETGGESKSSGAAGGTQAFSPPAKPGGALRVALEAEAPVPGQREVRATATVSGPPGAEVEVRVLSAGGLSLAEAPPRRVRLDASGSGGVEIPVRVGDHGGTLVVQVEAPGLGAAEGRIAVGNPSGESDARAFERKADGEILRVAPSK